MRRISSIVLACIVTLFIVAGSFYYFLFGNYYRIGENDSFTCKVGESFKVRLRENGSTGCVNCWLNEQQSRIVKKVNREYVPSINSRLGYDGAGGIIVLTFKAISPGRDTIKMSNCFVGDRECTYYTPENTSSDNEFIVDVNE